MRKVIVLALAAAVCLWAGSASAYSIVSSQALGQAAGFNVFTFGGLNVANSDIEGPVAVGGNAVVNGGYTVASVTVGGDFYVGGDLTWNGTGSVNYGNGDIVHGGNLNFSNSQGVNRGNDFYENPFPIDFATTQTLVQGNSAYWGTLAPTGNTTSQYGTMSLNATQDGLNVFTVDGSLLYNNTSNFVLDASGFSNVTALINVTGGDGSTIGYNNGGFSLNGLGSQNVMFNFFEATDEVDLRGVGFMGSIVAATGTVNVDFDNGNFDGQIIAYSLGVDGNPSTGQVDLPLFEGDLPVNPTAAVPVPAAVWLLGAGLAGVFARRRK